MSQKTGVPKPAKPYPSFPLFAHSNGQWAKKIHGRLRYFGPWEDPKGALENYRKLENKPTKLRKRLTLSDGLNRFLGSRKTRVDNGELAHRSWKEYESTARFLVRHFGRDAFLDAFSPWDWETYRAHRATTRDLVSLGNEIQRVRTMVTWACKTHSLPAPRFGEDFRKPGKRKIKASQRRNREEAGIDAPIFAAADLRWIISHCGTQLRAMTLLGINAAYYPSDSAALRIDHLKLDSSWLSVPRTKTEEDRDCHLWPETVSALETWLAERQMLGVDGPLVFRRRGDKEWNDSANMATKHFTSAMRAADVRTGSFRWLRNTFETIAGNTADQIAVDRVMGHVDPSIAAVYRHGIEPERIKRVCDHVRSWLYG